MRALLTCIYLLVVAISYGQLTGKVIEFQTGKILPGAEVFVDRSIRKAIADDKGIFTIEGLQVGAAYKVASFLKGYQLDVKKVTIDEGENIVLFILNKDNARPVRDRDVRDDLARKISKQADLFPEWVDSFIVRGADIRTSDTNQFYGSIGFQNQTLGYSVTCYLNGYPSSPDSVLTFFTPLLGTPTEQQRWEEYRFLRYLASTNHFLESVLQSTTSLAGFQIHNEKDQPLDVSHLLAVGYRGETNSLSLGRKVRVDKKVDAQTYTSWIEAEKIIFNDEGAIVNIDSVKLEGVFANNQLSALLPIDYSAPLEWKQFRLKPYFEKAYLHTDKPYYYPGDTVWFKAYMNYETLSLIESLSTVLYVELFEKSGNKTRLVQKKILKIDDGEAWGEFVLSDTLSTDYIALRAYTSWQRNYGDDQIYVKAFPVVRRKLNIRNSRLELVTDKSVNVYFDKPSYTTREKISGTIIVKNEKGQLVPAWMSVSVTDRSMVRLVADSSLITAALPVKKFEEPTQIKFPLERGLSLSGQFFKRKDKPAMVDITLTSFQFEQGFEFTTDLEGKFFISGIEFADSARVQYIAREKKYTVSGTVEPVVKESFLLEMNWPEETQLVEEADYKIDKNTIMLNAVVVEGKKLEEEQKKGDAKDLYFRPFGQPDYILSEKNFNQASINVIEMIRGRLPGWNIVNSGGNYTIQLNRALSLSLDTSPVILVDDMIMGGPASQTLLMLNPSDIATVEVINRLNPLLGSAGANGSIAIYTKSGGLRGVFADSESLNSFMVKGFNTPARFKGLDHNRPIYLPESDFRTTLFWSPSVIASAKSSANFEFYASDSEGPYLITIEGVTMSGTPFHHEVTLESITKKNN